MMYRKINTLLQYKFCSMDFYLKLDIVFQIVYNNIIVYFCPPISINQYLGSYWIE